MNRRILLVILALLISGGGVFLGLQWMRGSAHASVREAKADPKIQVLVAKTDLPAGQFIRPENLAWQPWPAGPLPETYFVQSKTRMADFVGAVVRTHTAPGEPITAARVVRPGERGFMAAVLNPGDRALTVNVTASTGMAGFVYPGDRVDVILTMSASPPGGASRHLAETILRNVRVVGMDQNLNDAAKTDNKDVQAPKTATLEVTPKQAEALAVASDLGVLTLSLRSLAGPGDNDAGLPPSKTWDADVTQIPVSGPARPAGPSAPRLARGPAPSPGFVPWTVDVVRGSEVRQTPVAASTANAGLGRTAG